MADDIIPLRHTYALSMVERISDLTAHGLTWLRAEMQQVRLDHITTLAELQEAAAEIEWLKEALTDAQNETRRG